MIDPWSLIIQSLVTRWNICIHLSQPDTHPAISSTLAWPPVHRDLLKQSSSAVVLSVTKALHSCRDGSEFPFHNHLGMVRKNPVTLVTNGITNYQPKNWGFLRMCFINSTICCASCQFEGSAERRPWFLFLGCPILTEKTCGKTAPRSRSSWIWPAIDLTSNKMCCRDSRCRHRPRSLECHGRVDDWRSSKVKRRRYFFGELWVGCRMSCRFLRGIPFQ